MSASLSEEEIEDLRIEFIEENSLDFAEELGLLLL